MTTMLKRRMCHGNENIFHVPTDFGPSSGPKKARSLTLKLPLLGGNQEELKDIKRVTLSDEVKNRSLCILRTIMQHIFALPFLRMDDELVKNESNGRMNAWINDMNE